MGKATVSKRNKIPALKEHNKQAENKAIKR